jgi:hypothetical protein
MVSSTLEISAPFSRRMYPALVAISKASDISGVFSAIVLPPHKKAACSS